MPDTRLTLAGIREHLRKHVVVYVVGILLAVGLTNLLWTMTEPRVPGDRTVRIYMVDGYANADPLSGIAADMLARTQAFDARLQRVEFEGLYYTDPEENYAGVILLTTRLAAGEGDAFLASADAMARLAESGALLPLDALAEDGWLADSGLEPCYQTVVDDATGEAVTMLAGYRLDALDALKRMLAFDNEGACLAIAANCDNVDATLKAVEIMVEDLKNWSEEA